MAERVSHANSKRVHLTDGQGVAPDDVINSTSRGYSWELPLDDVLLVEQNPVAVFHVCSENPTNLVGDEETVDTHDNNMEK